MQDLNIIKRSSKVAISASIQRLPQPAEQESLKMTPTEVAVFLEGLEQAVHNADLEAGKYC